MMNELLKRPRSVFGRWARNCAGYGVAFGLAATLFAPADIFAAPIASVLNGQSQSPFSNLSRDNLLLAHCCHSHPYAPYDDYCCHDSAGYRAGRAAVGAAVAYGTYRGVKKAHKNYHKKHDKKYHSRRR